MDPAILESPEDVLSTMTRDGRRRWLYPTVSKGRWRNARRLVAYLLMVAYVLLPWIYINGHPAIKMDIVHREFALFGLVFYPTDTVLLMLTMISIMITVIMLTTLFGRVWCGWGCPQTVYLEFLFRPIETWIEGKPHVKQRRDQGPWNLDRTSRHVAKWAIYLVIALVLANTFVAYIVGWETLLGWMVRPPSENTGFFGLMALTTGLIVYDFGYFREQMCTIACPYARMQSIMLDPHSLIVSYDAERGEPRGKPQEGVTGDCIACNACVRTCPTGIDIREGLQMECIACTQCIDACDHIMDKLEKPRGLIRYTSEQALAGERTKLLRPRTLVYGGMAIVLFTAFMLVLTGRDAFDIAITRSVGAPFSELADGRVANRIKIRVRNQTQSAQSFTGIAPLDSDITLQPVGVLPMDLDPGEMRRLEVWVLTSPDVFQDGLYEATFELSFDDGTQISRDYTLLGPTAP